MTDTQTTPRCGDIVLHRPSKERWVVAYADAENDVLEWVGWPPGRAKLSDCVVMERVSDAKHKEMVAAFEVAPAKDDRGLTKQRRATVLRKYGRGSDGR